MYRMYRIGIAGMCRNRLFCLSGRVCSIAGSPGLPGTRIPGLFFFRPFKPTLKNPNNGRGSRVLLLLFGLVVAEGKEVTAEGRWWFPGLVFEFAAAGSGEGAAM